MKNKESFRNVVTFIFSFLFLLLLFTLRRSLTSLAMVKCFAINDWPIHMMVWFLSDIVTWHVLKHYCLHMYI